MVQSTQLGRGNRVAGYEAAPLHPLDKKGACREARPLLCGSSDDGHGYFNASMPAPKLM